MKDKGCPKAGVKRLQSIQTALVGIIGLNGLRHPLSIVIGIPQNRIEGRFKKMVDLNIQEIVRYAGVDLLIYFDDGSMAHAVRYQQDGVLTHWVLFC